MNEDLGVLVLDDDEAFRRTLSSLIRTMNYNVYEASSASSALEVYRQYRPGIIFADICMPGMNGVEFTRTICLDDPSPLVAAITGRPQEEVVLQCIRAGASEFLKKPVSLAEVKDALLRLSVLARRRRQKFFEKGSLVQSDLQFEIYSRAVSIGPMIKTILTVLRGFIEAQSLVHIELAIDEALRNAYEHGNLGIRSSEKELLCENEDLEEALKQREEEAVRAGKTIKIGLQCSDEEFVCAIEDQGDGFNWRESAAVNATAPDRLAALHGRGLLLIKNVFDEVFFNEKGNKITLLKKLK